MNKRRQLVSLPIMVAVALAVSLTPSAARAQDAKAPQAVTTGDPTIPVDELELLLKPLTKDELIVEADAWRDLVKAKVAEISAAELAVKKSNRAVSEAEQIAAEAEEAAESKTESAAPKTGEESKPNEQAEAAQQAAEAQKAAKAETLTKLNTLREQRTALVDRMDAVLDELERKGGDPAPYRTYLNAIAGLNVDVTDTAAAWTAFVGWLQSSQGGVRWGLNIVKFIVTLIVFWILAAILGKGTRKALQVHRKASMLLQEFLVHIVRRATLLVGLMVAITMLEISIGPVVAVIGAAGFVVAFALQGTLSNFASGIMILAYRPFDVGDAVSVAGGISGSVDAMNLVSTQIKSWDNQRIIVPNNAIWGNVITNITGLPIRRVDLTFGIGYSDDADKAQAILEDILKNHELVLDDPAPVIKLHELGDSSVNFICRPWTKTSDYWTVYWDVTRTAKERFDAEGISIPFPQRDVHIHQAAAVV